MRNNFSSYIDINDKYMSLFFDTLAKAQITAGHIAGLLEGLMANINMIITVYKRKGVDANGNLCKEFIKKKTFPILYYLTFNI